MLRIVLITSLLLLLSFCCHAFKPFPAAGRNSLSSAETCTPIRGGASSSLSSANKNDSAATPSCDIVTKDYNLSSGVTMQVLSSQPKRKWPRNSKLPPILFLHGSFHGAWCWAEHYFPYFIDKGYSVVAPNWRGTGGTFAGEGVKKVKIMEHVADLEAVLDEVLPDILQRQKQQKPVVVCHSFGGLALMKHLESHPEQAQQLAEIVTICSVPPSGNGKMTMRYLRRSWSASYKITVGFAMKKCLVNDVLCRQLFFGGEKILGEDGTVLEDYGVSDQDIARYQEYFARDSEATIDLLDLAKQLPSAVTTDDGKAPFVDQLPPCLVMGATDDFIVDTEGYQETAAYFGLNEHKVVDSPHDVMLGAKWRNAAEALEEWIEENVVA